MTTESLLKGLDLASIATSLLVIAFGVLAYVSLPRRPRSSKKATKK